MNRVCHNCGDWKGGPYDSVGYCPVVGENRLNESSCVSHRLLTAEEEDRIVKLDIRRRRLVP